MNKMLAECFGTFVLVLGGCGTALFAGSTVGFLGVAIAFGLTVIAMAYGIGHVSGAHLNPAVSFGRIVDAGTEMTIYYPYLCVPAKDFTTGSTVKLYGRDTPTGGSNIEIASKTLTTTVDNDRGRMYTINF